MERAKHKRGACLARMLRDREGTLEDTRRGLADTWKGREPPPGQQELKWRWEAREYLVSSGNRKAVSVVSARSQRRPECGEQQGWTLTPSQLCGPHIWSIHVY